MKPLESQFSEENYLLGETLYEQESILEARKLKGNLWSFEVRDDTVYEVEVKSYGTKSTTYTCDCDSYGNQKQCPHIVAAMLHLRKLITDKQKVPSKQKPKVKNLSINTIMEHVEYDDLVKFIKFAARKDRALNFLFKAVFAPRLDMEDNAKKYSDLLQALIKPISTSGSKSSNSDIRLAIRLIQEFQDQLEDALTLGQYVTVFDIIKGVLSKIHYLHRNYPTVRKHTSKSIILFNKHVADLYNLSLAPALLDQLDDVLSSVATLSYYNYIDVNNEIIYNVYSNRRKEAIKVLKEQLQEKPTSKFGDEEKPIILAVKKLYKVDTEQTEVTDQQLIDASKILQGWKESDHAISLIKGSMSSKERNRTLEHALIERLYESGNDEEGNKLAIRLFTEHREFRYLRKLKEVDGGQIGPAIKASIAKELKKIKEQYQFKATYYREIEDLENLCNTLGQSEDLQLIMEHDAYLYKEDYVKLESIYVASVTNYLDSHAGSIAASFMTEVLTHLTNIDALKLHKTISNLLEKDYSHRTGLLEFK